VGVYTRAWNRLREGILSIPGIGAFLRFTKSKLRRDPDRYLRRTSGVIHVGANTGQERTLYEKYGLRVIWIEPIPEIFETLKANLQSHPRQSAFQYLVTDKDDAEYAFHVSNNSGASSSILDLKLHKDIWPEVSYDKTITLRSTTLVSLLKNEHIDTTDYDALIMDTQGSELLVLKGAAPVLHMFRFIKTEVSDFESYAGGCQLRDIDLFLKEHGFEEISRNRFAEGAKSGSYYDIVYERKVL
jgi:FkbM family methyltransferase